VGNFYVFGYAPATGNYRPRNIIRLVSVTLPSLFFHKLPYSPCVAPFPYPVCVAWLQRITRGTDVQGGLVSKGSGWGLAGSAGASSLSVRKGDAIDLLARDHV
jgi:hypothetical protein